MKRTQRLGIILAALVMVMGFGPIAGSNAADPITIKLAHPNVPQHPMGEGYELFKKDLEERSGGAFKVDIYDSSKYGNFDAVVQGLQMNMLQMG